MLRLTLGAAGLLAAVLVAPLVVIRARPYDGSDLRACLVPPDDCAAPCFMDIQPGITAAGEALNRLAAHGWVQDVDIMETPIRWTWSGRQPGWIDEHVPGTIATERFLGQVRDDAVVSLVVQSRLAARPVLVSRWHPGHAIDSRGLLWSRMGRN